MHFRLSGKLAIIVELAVMASGLYALLAAAVIGG